MVGDGGDGVGTMMDDGVGRGLWNLRMRVVLARR